MQATLSQEHDHATDNPIPESLFPILLHIPCSLYRVPYSLLPVPCSLFPAPCTVYRPTLAFTYARSSRPMTLPMSATRLMLNDALRAHGAGNEVGHDPSARQPTFCRRRRRRRRRRKRRRRKVEVSVEGVRSQVSESPCVCVKNVIRFKCEYADTLCLFCIPK